MTRDELVEVAARAIEGPYFPVPESSRFSLEELREVRWNRLSAQERKVRLLEGQAALDALLARLAAPDDATVERVARGIYLTTSEWTQNHDCWTTMPDYGREVFHDRARAAITAHIDTLRSQRDG